MSAVVKFPPNVADEPDCRFCGLCGRRNQPLDASGDSFGPCIDGADNVIDCGDLQRQIVQAHDIGQATRGGLHPDWAALIARLGIPDALVAEWRAKAMRVAAIKMDLRLGGYGMAGGAPFVAALDEWMRGDDAEERLLALIEHLKPSLDPAAGGAKRLNWVEMVDWFERVGARASDILSDPGDWEFEGADE